MPRTELKLQQMQNTKSTQSHSTGWNFSKNCEKAASSQQKSPNKGWGSETGDQDCPPLQNHHMVNWDMNNRVWTGKVLMDSLCWRTTCHCLGRPEKGWWEGHSGEEEEGKWSTEDFRSAGNSRIFQRAENLQPPPSMRQILCSFQKWGE